MTVSGKESTLRSEDDIPGTIRTIHAALAAEKPNIEQLRRLCVLPGGLLTNSLRERVWPLIVGAYGQHPVDEPTDEGMKNHRDARVVDLDVERLLKRYPPHISAEERLQLENSLKRIIMRTLRGIEHAYYQGFHDIAITVHLVFRDDDSLSVVSLELEGAGLTTGHILIVTDSPNQLPPITFPNFQPSSTVGQPRHEIVTGATTSGSDNTVALAVGFSFLAAILAGAAGYAYYRYRRATKKV